MFQLRGSHDDRGRGQSPVLAVIVLTGMVAMVSVGMLVVAEQTLTQYEDRAEVDRVERAFVAFSENLDTVSYAGDGTRAIDFSLDRENGAIRRADTGWINVTTEGGESVNSRIGAVEYVSNDGTVITYQSGGVWRGTGADSRMISPPSIHYRDATLTLPITVVEGEREFDSGSVTMSNTGIEPRDELRLVEGEVVSIEIQSEYYAGWAEFFTAQTNANAVTVDHASQTVEVELGLYAIDGDFAQGVYAQGDVAIDCNTQHTGIVGPVVGTGSIDEDCVEDGDAAHFDTSPTAIDRAIERKIADAKNDSSVVELTGPQDLGGGNTYYAPDGLTLASGESIAANLSEGDVTLIVDGDLEMDGSEFHVVNADGDDAFRVYLTGNLSMKNAEYCVTCDEADPAAAHNQVYGTSTTLIGISHGDSFFEGTIYAPRSEPALDGDAENSAYRGPSGDCELDDGTDADTCIGSGGPVVVGSIVGGPIAVTGQQGSRPVLAYDEGLESVEPDLGFDDAVIPPEISHLHVVEYTIEVRNG